MLRRLVLSEYLVLLLCGLLFLVLAPVTPGLVSVGNLGNLLANLLPLLVVTTGLTVVLIAGGIDLSVTATIALASVVGAKVMNGDDGLLRGSVFAVPAGVAAMLAVGAAAGLFNGLAVTRLKMPAFIVTLTSMMFLSGLAVWLTRSRAIANLPGGFTVLGTNLACALAIAAVLALLAEVMLSRAVFGRWLYAIGHNAETARVSGVPVEGVLLSAYIACGVFAAAASVLYSARLETGSPVLGQRILLDVIGAAVVGGTSLFGGKGRIAWTLFGVLFLTLLDNALNLLGLTHFAIMMVKGAVILLAALLDATRQRWLAA